MASYQLPEAKQSSAVATIGKKLILAVVALALGVLALKILVGIVAGLISTVLTFALVIVVVVAAVWAVRKL